MDRGAFVFLGVLAFFVCLGLLASASMPFPIDWPTRWWVRKGEVAAIFKLPSRPAVDVTFTGDDARTLWEFEIEGLEKPILWDHSAHHFAAAPRDSDVALQDALSTLMPKLTGGRERW